jgi:hypothetical protein
MGCGVLLMVWLLICHLNAGTWVAHHSFTVF